MHVIAMSTFWTSLHNVRQSAKLSRLGGGPHDHKSAVTTRETQDRAARLEARIQRLFKRSQFDDELLGLVESLSGLVKDFRPEDPPS